MTITDPPSIPQTKLRYDLWVIGISIALIIATLTFANNVSWQFSWRTNGVNNLLSSAGAIFVISLAIERYIKVFLVDSKDDELTMLRTLLQDKEIKLNVLNQEILKSKLNSLQADQQLVNNMWQIHDEMMQTQTSINSILITRKERLRLIGFVIGGTIALIGLPLLNDIVVISGTDAWIAERIIKCVDVLLISALISGGSTAITSFFDAIKLKLQTKP
jgi:hypothetical protein